MELTALPVNARAAAWNDRIERTLNRLVRGRDRVLARVGLGGRRADYDDEHYEFVGGARDDVRKKHYDKSLRLLWKAEAHAPWSSFRDMNEAEKAIAEMAEQAMTPEEKAHHARVTSAEFRAFLDATYTPRQKEALVRLLTAIGHGEAYAWLVSADVLRQVKGSGAKAAVTMQVLEEAKHFVVMRELIAAFGVPAPRQSSWEYVLLEGILKTDGLDKLYGMNVLVESIALSIFGAVAHLPGLEVLRMFHLDEARHTALPANYFRGQKDGPGPNNGRLARLRRLRMTLPALPLILLLEPELAALGIDAFDFAGSILRKVAILSERAGFQLAEPAPVLLGRLNGLFNAYCRATRPGHQFKNFTAEDTSRDASVAKVEAEVFAA
jgi:hypothetical protein